MKNITWIVQPDVFTEDQKEETYLILRESGMKVTVVEPYFKEPATPFTDIMLRGSFGLVSWLNTEAIRKLGKMVINQDYWIPFSFAELPKYFNATLNDDIVWMTLPEAQKCLQVEGTMFVRPDSGKKTFSGQLFDYDKLSTEIAFLQQRNIETDFLVGVAKPKELNIEARFVIVDKKIISQSVYSDRGSISFLGEVPKKVTEFANECLNSTAFPEPHFVLDLAETTNGIKVVEVNAIETSSYYNSDRKAIYQALQQALQEGKVTHLLS